MKLTKNLLITFTILLLFFCAACENEGESTTTPSTGEITWTTNMQDGRVTAQPIVSGETLLIERDCSLLQAIDGQTEQIKWTFKDEIYNNLVPGASLRSPVVANGVVFWANAFGNVYAIDLLSGEQIWKFKASTQIADSGIPNESFPTPPVYKDGKIYAMAAGRKLLAIDALNGQLIWENNRPLNTQAFIHLQENKIIMSNKTSENNYNISAFNTTTGQEEWRYNTSHRPDPFIFGDGQFVYFKCGHAIKGLNPETGNKSYELNTKLEGNLIFKTEDLFFIIHNNKIISFDKTTKQKKWDYTIERTIITKPGFINDILFIADTEIVHGLDAFSGEAIWTKQIHQYNIESGGPIEPISAISSPAIGQQNLYVEHNDIIYAIKR